MKKIILSICLLLACSSPAWSIGMGNTGGVPIATGDILGRIKGDKAGLSLAADGTLSIVRAYAEIYVAGGSTIQSLPSGATYTKITPFVTNGLYANATPDHANDKITITKSGKYIVGFYFSSIAGTNDVELTTSIFVDGVQLSNLRSLRATKASTISVSACAGIVNLAAGQEIDVRCIHSSGSATDLTVINGSLSVQYIGE